MVPGQGPLATGATPLPKPAPSPSPLLSPRAGCFGDRPSRSREFTTNSHPGQSSGSASWAAPRGRPPAILVGGTSLLWEKEGSLATLFVQAQTPTGPVGPRGEALFRCARPSGVPRGPATSTGSLASQRHPGKFPKVPGRRRGMFMGAARVLLSLRY